MNLAIIMPVYNEEGAIKNVLNAWEKVLIENNIDGAIFAYNDGSKDQTLKIMNDIAAKSTKINVIDKPNSGHGPTILKGYRDNSQAKWLFQIDSDDEMGAENFVKLWNKRENYDFLLCSRNGRNSPLARKIITFTARTIVNIFYKGRVFDVNSPYRLMRNEKFQGLFNEIPHNTFAPNVIVSGFASAKGLRIYQSTAEFTERQTGVVSIQKFKLLKIAIKSFCQTIAFRLQNSNKLF